jgi:hypothetical protein
MPLEKAVMEDAIAVDKDNVVGVRTRYRLVDDDRFAKAVVGVPLMLDWNGEAIGVPLDGFCDCRARTIVGDDDFKIAKSLVQEALEHSLEKIIAVVHRDDER